MLMDADEASCWCRTRWPSKVLQWELRLAALGAEAGADPRLNKAVRSHVHRLFLAPHKLRIGEAADLPHHEIKREWVELLDTHKRHLIVKLAFLPLLQEFVVDLPRAHDNALEARLLRRPRRTVRGRNVHDEPLESNALDAGIIRQVVEFPDRRFGHWVAKKVLWRKVDEWLPELPVDLAPEEVEVVSRRRHISDLPVGVLDLIAQVPAAEPLLIGLGHVRESVRMLVAHLEKPFHPCRAVLGALPVVPVREKAGEARLAQPFGLTSREELVKDDLSAIGKVAKLCLP
mmetsp:Transcript_25970/g.61748  ORF Transcript_25970/g.61748 Transcript_25970/m.61748 type:complete len:288 (-) Transcript_25970:2510-3373(-)